MHKEQSIFVFLPCDLNEGITTFSYHTSREKYIGLFLPCDLNEGITTDAEDVVVLKHLVCFYLVT